MASINKTSYPATESVDCPKCNAEITLHDPEGSEYLACANCGSYLKFTTNDELIIKKPHKKLSLKPLLPIGLKGVLQGDEFKVIAYAEKKEKGTKYAWREYILYNFIKGYATLVEYDGHWSIIKGANFIPELNTIDSDRFRNVSYNNISFRLFNKYTPVAIELVGEFDYDVLDDRTKAREFIAPPFLIVEEVDDNNIPIFYLGEYLEPKIVAEAFSLNIDLFPSKVGIGAIQPSKFYERWNSLFTISGIAIVLVLVIHLIIGQLKPEKELINDSFTINPIVSTRTDTASITSNSIAAPPATDTDEFKSFVTPSFNINDEASNIEFNLSSPVDNNWLEATIVLVNEDDNKTWEVSKGIEYYSGVESGESWSEGSRTAEIMVSNIPKGKYHLNVYPAAGSRSQTYIDIKATANSSMWRNTLLTALLLCIYPAYCWVRMRYFEKSRWDNSDFSPFST